MCVSGCESDGARDALKPSGGAALFHFQCRSSFESALDLFAAQVLGGANLRLPRVMMA